MFRSERHTACCRHQVHLDPQDSFMLCRSWTVVPCVLEDRRQCPHATDRTHK